MPDFPGGSKRRSPGGEFVAVSSSEPGLSDGRREASVGKVDPTVLNGEAVVGVEGVHASGEQLDLTSPALHGVAGAA
jgi:hypothetical protein